MQNWGRNNSRFLLIHQQKKFLNSSFLGFTFRFSAICWMMNSTQFRFVIWFQFAIRVENIFLFTGKTIFFLGNFSCRRLFIILIIIYFFTLKIRQTFIVVSANFLSVFLFLISIVFSSKYLKTKMENQNFLCHPNWIDIATKKFLSINALNSLISLDT